MHVLFVKLTSMGDLIHALPALTDARNVMPDITFDWVIDKSFAEVASWHPAVGEIIPASHRTWRKHLLRSLKNKEIQHFLKSLRSQHYDKVIDGQSSLKSAVVTRLAKGERHGLDSRSCRERLAPFAYSKQHFVHRNLQAITRLRLLFAQVFQYPYPDTPPDYGIANYVFPQLSFPLPEHYVVLVHNASWSTKMWPERNWRELIALAADEQYQVLLPWGSEAERQRATRIAAGFSNAEVLPALGLSQQAAVLQGASGAICSDTGLSHLAAALGVPAVTLYGPTSKDLTGAIGHHQQHLVSPFVCTLCYQHQCYYGDHTNPEPLCMLAITPQVVWERFILTTSKKKFPELRF